MVGIGGGGDVVGSLALARLCESLGTPASVGGVAWERLPIDPRPGPRPPAEIHGGERAGEHAVLADGETTTPDGVRFSESVVAAQTGVPTALIDVTAGAVGAAQGLVDAAAALGADLVVLADVGGDAVATGAEPGLASPLCDATMLAAGFQLAARGDVAVLGAVLGAGCDGELEPSEVLGRIAAIARLGAWVGSWSLTPAIADEVEAVARASSTEASLAVVRCTRGEIGPTAIRGGRRTVELGPAGAIAFFYSIAAAEPELPLARAVAGSGDLEQARQALAALGVRTELDWERRSAAAGRRDSA